MHDAAHTVTLFIGSIINGPLNMGSDAGASLTLDGAAGSEIYSEAVTGATTFKGALTKQGGGTWTLDQALADVGSTEIEEGSLNVNAALGGDVNVHAGATLGGTGTIAGDLTIASGGRIAPGNSIGTLNVGGSVTWAAGAALEFELGAAGSSDRLAISDALTRSGTGAFEFDFADTGELEHDYTLVTFASTDFTAEDFSAVNLADGVTGRFTIVNDALHFVTLSPPEISSAEEVDGIYGSPFTHTVEATNSPTSFSISAGDLPDGLVLDAEDGLISGTPTEAGTFNVTTRADNGGGFDTAPLEIVIAPATVTAVVTIHDKTYDGSTSASIATRALSGVVGGDDVSLAGGIATFANANAGSNKTVTISGLSLAGTDAANYMLASTNATATADIVEPDVEAIVTLGSLSHVYDGAPKRATVATSPHGLNVRLTYNGSTTPPIAAGRYAVRADVNESGYTGSATATLIIAPAVPAEAPPVTAALDGPATFTAGAEAGASLTYQWQKNGADIPGETGPTLTLDRARPEDVGFYSVLVTSGGVTTRTPAAPLELMFAGQIAGDALRVGTDIRHPNGNIYDQVLLTGKAVSVKADPGEIVRVSYVDLSDDIVQVEFAGAGVLTLSLADGYSGPATPVNYHQPDVAYMKGHATVFITGADETSHVTIFSVGRRNAVNQELFHDDVDYDGVADLALTAIASANGKFGGVRTGNVGYADVEGWTGVHARSVALNGPLFVGDISAADEARGVLIVGATDDARITGGDLLQANAAPVEVSGMSELQFTNGEDSHGRALPAQPNRATLVRNGIDVTNELVP